jgi:hypothetical protein
VRVTGDAGEAWGARGFLRDPLRAPPPGWDHGIERSPELRERDLRDPDEIPDLPGCSLDTP